jgi:thioredoxin-dependent peroxiredoxin
VAYFMVSVDDLDTNTRFAAEYQADFPILSDPDKTVATAYGVIPEGRERAARWTFYIGPDGKILFIDKKVQAQTAGEGIAAKLAELNVKRR